MAVVGCAVEHRLSAKAKGGGLIAPCTGLTMQARGARKRQKQQNRRGFGVWGSIEAVKRVGTR
jgi:hypothetical protein